MMDNSAQTVLVVGGSGVIGQTLASHFAKQQWRVGIHYHTQDSQAQTLVQAIIQGNGTAKAFPADIRNPEEVDRMVKCVLAEWQRIEVLVYAVGINIDRLAIQLRPEEWNHIIHTNLTGAFHCIKSVAPTFQHQGDGSILLIGSLSGSLGKAGQTGYSASKAGLLGLVKSSARELGAFNIRINCIFPGWHISPLSHKIFSTHDLSDQVLGHPPSLSDVSHLAYHLATNQGISGQIFNLDNRIS